MVSGLTAGDRHCYKCCSPLIKGNCESGAGEPVYSGNSSVFANYNQHNNSKGN